MFKPSKLAALLLAVSLAGAARADDKEKNKPQEFFRAATVINNIKQMSETLGVEPPPLDFLFKQAEQRYSFFTPGSIVMNKPIGVIGYTIDADLTGSLESAINQYTAFVIPVAADTVSLDALQKYAVDIDPNAATKDNLVAGKNIAMKRTPDYLLWSDSAAATHVPDNPFAQDFKNPNVIAVASLDLAAVRKSAPKFEDLLVAEISTHAAREFPLAPVAVNIARELVDSIDTISLNAAYDQNNLKYTAVIAPAAIQSAVSFPRPAFTEPQFIELHVAWPNAKFAGWLPEKIAALDAAKLAVPGLFDQETAGAARDGLARAAKLFLGADAISAGVTVNNGTPLVVMINQYSKDIDAEKEIRDIAAIVKTIAKKQKTPNPIDVSNITVGDQKIIRVTILDSDEPQFYIDLAQSGRKLAVVFSREKPETKAADLLKTPAAGKITDLLDMTINPVPLVQMSMGHFLPPEALDKMKAGIGDSRYTVTAKSDAAGKSMIVEINAPAVIAREMEKAMKTFRPPPPNFAPNGPGIQIDE